MSSSTPERLTLGVVDQLVQVLDADDLDQPPAPAGPPPPQDTA